MKDPAAVLIKPFDGIWRALAAQSKAWVTIHNLITQSIQLPARLNEVQKELSDLGVDLRGERFSKLVTDANAAARDTATLASSQQEAIVYPGLVGAWAIVEAAFDDLILNVLTNDPKALEKLISSGIKPRATRPPGTREWSEQLYKTLEGRSKNKAKGFVVEFHKACFGALGIELKYPGDRSRVIEELNQVRNCILHRQGIIDEKASNISPRLAQYLGSPIPSTDSLFRVALHMLLDYTMAWIAAFVHSPYLRAGLKSDAKNPFES